ncbi:chemotaxis protein CheD [uncultured Tateyamaria sp.]|uniref:chemotaxis protein CheD n=1 Tax=uncultured Tateyamaria sp. TaxID=455651 RepID=UPI0026075611|nr:chemotaxis protein CheD [uncultured Tateyamaria sp.]
MTPHNIHITQGEHATGVADEVVISTLLGSCVACCLWDPVNRVGGMNHMLLALSGANDTSHTLSGINAMEVLINDLIKLGAVRNRLQAKAFGGARMISGFSDIGAQNATFTVQYLAQEGIPLVTQSLGGNLARNLRFWPGSGRAMQKVTDVTVRDVEVGAPAPSGNGLELF